MSRIKPTFSPRSLMRRIRQYSTGPRPWYTSSLVLPLIAALGGCAVTPMPKLDRQTPSHWRHQVGKAGIPPADLHGWWKAFDDPMLNRLVDSALKSNPDARGALERLRAARALYRVRQAPVRPQLGVHTDDPVDPDASASYFVVGFDATWELGLFGRGAAIDRIAAGRLGEAQATLREVRISLVAEVVRDFIQLRAAQRREELLERIVDARRRQAQLEQTRVKLHLDSPTQLAQANAAVAAAQAALSEPRAALNAAAQRLAMLLGRDEPDAAWLKPAALPVLGPTGPIAAPADLLRSRPGIARARARVLRAAGELGIAHANRMPRIGLGTSLLWSTNIATYRPTGTTHYIGTVGPQIDIPLFDWGMRKARETAQSHELKAAVLAYRKAVLAGVTDVETALGNLQQQRRREEAIGQACAVWDDAQKVQRTRRRLGLASDFAGAKIAIASAKAELQLAAARRDRDIAYVALYKALGGAPPLPASDDAVVTAGQHAP